MRAPSPNVPRIFCTSADWQGRPFTMMVSRVRLPPRRSQRSVVRSRLVWSKPARVPLFGKWQLAQGLCPGTRPLTSGRRSLAKLTVVLGSESASTHALSRSPVSGSKLAHAGAKTTAKTIAKTIAETPARLGLPTGLMLHKPIEGRSTKIHSQRTVIGTLKMGSPVTSPPRKFTETVGWVLAAMHDARGGGHAGQLAPLNERLSLNVM